MNNEEKQMKHTPGPWGFQGPKKSEFMGGQIYFTIHVPGTYDAIGFLYPYSKHSLEQQEANTRLIAAAPEMLEILRALEPKLDARYFPASKDVIQNLLKQLES